MSELYTRYIKISKLDADGNDISPTLANLTTITIPWEDGSIAQYNVLGSTSTTEYYNFVVEYEPTSSIDFTDSNIIEEVNIPFTSSLDTSSSQYAGAYSVIVMKGIGSINNQAQQDPLRGYHFNSSLDMGLYQVRTYLQQDLYIRISGSLTMTSGFGNTTFLQFIKSSTESPTYSNSFGYQTWTPGSNFIGSPFFFSGSNAPGTVPVDFDVVIPSQSLSPGDFITLGNSATRITDFAVYSFDPGTTFFITSSYATPAGSTIVLEPPFTSLFKDSDCDVLQGNVLVARPNNQLQDMDFSTSQVKPVNYEALINYTAKKASYPLSSFTQTSILSPEYSSKNVGLSEFYNSGDGFNAQSSVATNVIYFENYGGPYALGGYSNGNKVYPKYIITAEEEVIDVSANDDLSQGTLRQTMGSFANIPEYHGVLGAFPNVKGGLITDAGFIEASFNGLARVASSIINDSQVTTIDLITKVRSGSGVFPSPAAIGGYSDGLLYAGGIENTSAADLPSKAIKILAEKNLI